MATPERQRRLRLPDLRPLLEGAGYQVVIDAGVLLLVRREVESSIYPSGKVILKTTDGDIARAAYDDLRPHLESAWS